MLIPHAGEGGHNEHYYDRWVPAQALDHVSFILIFAILRILQLKQGMLWRVFDFFFFGVLYWK